MLAQKIEFFMVSAAHNFSRLTCAYLNCVLYGIFRLSFCKPFLTMLRLGPSNGIRLNSVLVNALVLFLVVV